MATAQPGFPFTGTLGNYSVYKRRDLDKYIVRRKGGPSKEQIKNSPAFENTRRNNSEFGGRSSATIWLLWALADLTSLADYNIAGALNALIKPIQESDPVNEWGKRSIEFTRNPRILEGFNLNRRYTFDSIIRNSVRYTLDKQALETDIEIPALVPGVNFHVPGKNPFFSLVINTVLIPDLHHGPIGHRPANDKYQTTVHQIKTTEWYHVLNGLPEMSMKLKIDFMPPDEFYILMLSVGIRFGAIGANGEIEQVRHAGAAKIIMAV